jgi:GNAT superfamily N-acetyltransferase
MSRISETLYARYIESRLAARIIEDEYSFVIFKFAGKELFILDMCVDESCRGKGKGRDLINQLLEVAKKHDCDVITANVYLWDKEAMNTVRAAIEVGFKIKLGERDVLLIAKAVED